MEVRIRNGSLLPAEEQSRRWRRLAELLLGGGKEPTPTMPDDGELDQEEREAPLSGDVEGLRA